VALVIRRITIAVLAAFLAGAILAVPASSKTGPQAVAAKKKHKKCKKAKKGKKSKKRKGCKQGGGGGASSLGLPGQPTPSQPTPPDPPDTPPALNVMDLSLGAHTVFAGSSTTAEVTIDAPAPTGGQQVDLDSTDTSVSVPTSVVVAPTETTATFTVHTTQGVAATTTLTASIGGSQATADLQVVDTASLTSVQLNPHCLTVGGSASTGNVVTLNVPAPEATVVTLGSNDPALTVPDSVVVPAGQTSAAFPVTPVSAMESVSVTATLGTFSFHDEASVRDSADPTSASMTLDPDHVVSGDSSQATITLDCEASEDTTFTLSSQAHLVGNTTNVSVPPTVTVNAGERTATFPVSSGTANLDDYKISATAGSLTTNATLTVQGQPQ
jgi:hypothetical protein